MHTSQQKHQTYHRTHTDGDSTPHTYIHPHTHAYIGVRSLEDLSQLTEKDLIQAGMTLGEAR